METHGPIFSCALGRTIATIFTNFPGDHVPHVTLKFGQGYRSSLIASLRTNSPDLSDEWTNRFSLCAQRILSAVAFRETAFGSFKKTGSAILPPVGFYYSLFHMGVAMLCVDYATLLPQLKQMKHSRLQNLLKSKLVQRGLLKASYVKTLEKAQDLREHVNYVFGGKHIRDPHFIKQAMPIWHEKTGKQFQAALMFIKAVQEEYMTTHGWAASPIALSIGDDIGDDAFDMYLSDIEKKRVIRYLIKNDLTT